MSTDKKFIIKCHQTDKSVKNDYTKSIENNFIKYLKNRIKSNPIQKNNVF